MKTPLVLLLLFFETADSAFCPSLRLKQRSTRARLASNNKDDFFRDDDSLFNSDDDDDDDLPKLGIDLGKMLDPLTPEEAQALRAEASQLISERVAQGVDDIEALRAQLKDELELQTKERLEKSERAAKQASEQLLSKIDKLTDEFLTSSKEMRESTKLAAAADAANEGKGVEVGSWGSLGGVSVTTGIMLGSVAASSSSSSSAVASSAEKPASSSAVVGEEEAPAPAVGQQENLILILADLSQDSYAKTLIPKFTSLLQEKGIDVEILKPTQTMPLGGNNAACVLVFATSLTGDASSLKKMLDRLLRRTLNSGGGTPPTQLACLSTIGTERTDKVPYSMQNLLGGKLTKRRQVEEAVVNVVQQRGVDQTPLDYTILKVGELKDASSGEFELRPGDVLDGSTSADLAATTLMQAVAFQPYARNATCCVVGGLVAEEMSQQEWDEAFLRLDGPELMRFDAGDLGDVSRYDQLQEYLGEWAVLMEAGKKKLATPIRLAPSRIRQAIFERDGVKERAGVRLLFLTTKTGAAYMSRAEERAREKETAGSSGTTTTTAPKQRRTKPEGGVEVLVEVTSDDVLRVRAKRCNMADDTVLKEISEEKILKRLQDSLEVWKKDILT